MSCKGRSYRCKAMTYWKPSPKPGKYNSLKQFLHMQEQLKQCLRTGSFDYINLNTMPNEFNLIFTFVNNLKQLKTTVAIEYKKPRKSDIKNYHSCKYLHILAPKSAALLYSHKIIFLSKTLLPKEELVGSDNYYIQLSLKKLSIRY